ncbi:MAG TPA: heavy-metal-associated domain-containing protein [Acidobacteriaceae bacterium]|jgi:copper chaperone|nr:heavy-metal-associated domain-containing protein [Acidobacteriaceae bacterium]
MATLHLRIEGMHCGSCVRRVTQTVNSVPQTTADEVVVGAARVTTESAADAVIAALAAAGFRAHLEE